MTEDIHIRDAAIVDIPQVARIFGVTRKHDLAYLPDLHTPDENIAFFTKVFHQDRIVVAVEDGIVGFCAFREGWVDHLYVTPEFQDRGIGTELLRHAMQTYSKFQLWVFQKNSGARRFYERRGFILAEETSGSENEEKEPDVRYIWSKNSNDPS
jgi:putative acetyltransferase